MEVVLRYRVVGIKDGARSQKSVEYSSEAIAIGNAWEALGSEVLVAYPGDPVENPLAWFKSSIEATGGQNA